MPNRRSHEGKTQAERESYMATAIGRKPTPTVMEAPPDFDSTEQLLPPEPERKLPPPNQPPNQPAQPQKRVSHWLREHWLGVITAIVVAGVLGLISWALFRTDSLNREVGEMRVKVDETAKQQDQLREDLHRFEERQQQEMDRINDRLDRMSRP